MAITYATGLPTGHAQTLPSFRELLPPHLHDEIESTSYYTRERPPSSRQEVFSDPRSIPNRTPHMSPSKHGLSDFHRDYAVTLARTANASPVPQPSTPQHASRGPSPILPPIRDLQSLPDRNLNASGHPFPDARGAPTFPQDFRASHGESHPLGSTGPLMDRRHAEPYISGSAPPLLHTQAPYPYYKSDYEQASPQLLPHLQQSNFGIMGDSIDSKNKRRRGNLPKPVTDILRAWFHEHLDHPYPSEEDKQMFMTRTGLSISQISNWFINARRRQLPALRNQMRTGGSDTDGQRQSPLSDVESMTQESISSPNRP